MYRNNRIKTSRIITIMVVFGFAFLGLIFTTLYKIQITDHELYLQKAVSQQTFEIVIQPLRGSIYDRNYKLLAVSDSLETVFISPNNIDRNAGQDLMIAEGLSDILDVDYDDLFDKTQKIGRYYEIVCRKIEKNLADQVRSFIMENKLQNIVYIVPDYI